MKKFKIIFAVILICIAVIGVIWIEMEIGKRKPTATEHTQPLQDILPPASEASAY